MNSDYHPADSNNEWKQRRILKTTLACIIAVSAICALVLAVQNKISSTESPSSGSPSCMPSTFHWAVATAAYQVEGGYNETNREYSIWDKFCRTRPGVECADVADDEIHKYKEDIALMSKLNINSYRFSLSWSRMMSWNSTTRKMQPNPAGIAYYQKLIHELKNNFITPFITLYHWDLPQALEDNLDPPGWLNKDIKDHYEDYCRLAFQQFGNIVPYWFTFNEPWTFSTFGYSVGAHAPGRSSNSTEAYTVTHHVLISHATVVRLYWRMREQGQVMQRGRISIVVNSDIGIPSDSTEPSDIEAANRYNDYQIGWFLNPLAHGDYPNSMKVHSANNIPEFTEEESQLVKGTYDNVVGINHYTTHLITECDSPRSSIQCSSLPIGWATDLHVDSNPHPHGAVPSGTMWNGTTNVPLCAWHAGYPDGYGVLLDWVHNIMGGADILLTENGWCGNNTLDDKGQLWYYQSYVKQVFEARERGIPIIGYTAWSLLDNYEWGSYGPRFGLINVDYTTQERTPKIAAEWYRKLASTGCYPSS